MGFSVSGLSSGMDTDSLLQQLVDLRVAKFITPLETKISTIQEKQTVLAQFQAQTGFVAAAATALADMTVNGRSASSNSTDLTLLTTSEDTATGSYEVFVNSLSTTDRVYFNGVDNTTAQTFGTGTISITSGGITQAVSIDSTNNTLQGIVDAINDTNGINVTASIVDDGAASNPYRLVLTSKFSGTTGDITTDIASVLTLTEDAALTTTNDATDASITVNGLTILGDDNTFDDDAIPGLKFTINEVETTTAIKITVSNSTSAFKTALSNFVKDYNTLNTMFHEQFDYNESTRSLGVMGSDTGLQGLQSRLRSITHGIYTNLNNNIYKSIGSIGVEIGKDGKLSIDTARLDAALADNPEEVQKLITGDEDTGAQGIFSKLDSFFTDFNDSTDGFFTTRNETYDSLVEGYYIKIEDHEKRIDAYEALMKKKFLYMEQAMAKLQGQQSQLDNLQQTLKSLQPKES